MMGRGGGEEEGEGKGERLGGRGGTLGGGMGYFASVRKLYEGSSHGLPSQSVQQSPGAVIRAPGLLAGTYSAAVLGAICSVCSPAKRFGGT